MKVIETSYKGYRFRSRAEARWAVFFDAAGIEYEYEKEGFELPSGRYLPDFWLPGPRSWFEVKGSSPNDAEMILALELAEYSHSPVWIGHGPVTFEGHRIVACHDYGGVINRDQRFMDDRKHDGSIWISNEISARSISGSKYSDRWPHPMSGCFVNRCFDTAKSARFEFGECGAR